MENKLYQTIKFFFLNFILVKSSNKVDWLRMIAFSLHPYPGPVKDFQYDSIDFIVHYLLILKFLRVFLLFNKNNVV